jgi:hypothetical protein
VFCEALDLMYMPKGKGKVIPVQAEKLMFPQFQTFGSQMAAILSALRAGRF